MAHCDNCGTGVIRDAGGALVHQVSPPAFAPATCVMGVSGGQPQGSAAVTAVLCRDAGCPDDPDDPWWLDAVSRMKGTA